MDASDIAVIAVGANLAFYPKVDTVDEIIAQADVDEDFADRAEFITTLDEYVSDIETAMDMFDETDGVMHWSAPY